MFSLLSYIFQKLLVLIGKKNKRKVTNRHKILRLRKKCENTHKGKKESGRNRSDTLPLISELLLLLLPSLRCVVIASMSVSKVWDIAPLVVIRVLLRWKSNSSGCKTSVYHAATGLMEREKQQKGSFSPSLHKKSISTTTRHSCSGTFRSHTQEAAWWSLVEGRGHQVGWLVTPYKTSNSRPLSQYSILNDRDIKGIIGTQTEIKTLARSRLQWFFGRRQSLLGCIHSHVLRHLPAGPGNEVRLFKMKSMSEKMSNLNCSVHVTWWIQNRFNQKLGNY